MQNGECNVRSFWRCFAANAVWCVGIQRLRFCKWLWILDWSIWKPSVVDIPTQILLTILLSIDHSSRCKLKVYIVAHNKSHQRETIHHKSLLTAKLVKVKKSNIHILKWEESLLRFFAISDSWSQLFLTRILKPQKANLITITKTWVIDSGNMHKIGSGNLTISPGPTK